MPGIQQMIALGWGNPDSTTFRRDRISNLKVRGVVLPVNRNPDIQYLFRVLVIGLDGMGAKVAQHRDDWGYANRAIRGATEKSNHAWGLAVDIDALENLLGTTRTSFPVPRARALVKRLGMTKKDGTRVGIRWGHDYTGRKDPMHFEFIGSPADARAIVKRLRTRKALVALAAAITVPAGFFATNGLITPDPKPVPKPAVTTPASTPRPTTAPPKPTPTGTATGTAATSPVTKTKTVTKTTTATRRVTVTRTATRTVTRRYVVIRSGDTLSLIARSEGTSVAALRRLNPRLVPELLMPNTLVRIS